MTKIMLYENKKIGKKKFFFNFLLVSGLLEQFEKNKEKIFFS